MWKIVRICQLLDLVNTTSTITILGSEQADNWSRQTCVSVLVAVILLFRCFFANSIYIN